MQVSSQGAMAINQAQMVAQMAQSIEEEGLKEALDACSQAEAALPLVDPSAWLEDGDDISTEHEKLKAVRDFKEALAEVEQDD